jgi:hypothetical protein
VRLSLLTNEAHRIWFVNAATLLWSDFARLRTAHVRPPTHAVLRPNPRLLRPRIWSRVAESATCSRGALSTAGQSDLGNALPVANGAFGACRSILAALDRSRALVDSASALALTRHRRRFLFATWRRMTKVYTPNSARRLSNKCRQIRKLAERKSAIPTSTFICGDLRLI